MWLENLLWPSEEREWLSKNCLKLKQKLSRNSDSAFQEINQEFESQRFQLQQASRWADQAQRDKISLYGGLELRIGTSKKIMQEIAKKLKN